MSAQGALQGRSIVVTGGGSGLGFAMARVFHAAGARVALWGRTRKTLEEASASLGPKGKDVLFDVIDVRDYDGVGAGLARLVNEWGSVDGLVNNAAGNFLCASEDLSPGGFKSIVDIVLVGTFNCSRQFGAQFIAEKRPGVILNIATTYAATGSAFVLPSACAKAGVVALTGTLAYEWAEYGIRVNAIAPGPVQTEGAWKRLIPDKNIEKEWRERQPMKRFGRPEEIAQTALFLMSDQSSFITGECIAVDGGEHLSSGQFNFFATNYPRSELKRTFAKMRPERSGKDH